MNYKDGTTILVNKLNRIGWKVDLYNKDVPEDIYGTIYYKLKLIDINKDNNEEETFVTLAHEVGHMLSYYLLGNIVTKKLLGNNNTELMASVLGFIVVKTILYKYKLKNWLKYNPYYRRGDK